MKFHFLFFSSKLLNSSKMRNRNRQPEPSLVDTVRSHSASVAAFFEPALPYATQAAASALAFTAGLVATQVKEERERENPDDDDVEILMATPSFPALKKRAL